MASAIVFIHPPMPPFQPVANKVTPANSVRGSNDSATVLDDIGVLAQLINESN
jgi:hypothetical protein